MPTLDNSIGSFRFLVPYSNPMYFGKIVDGEEAYRVWDDALANEQFRHYVQKWSITDRLSFQFSWENYSMISETLYVKFYVNSTLKKTISHVITGNRQGTLYSDFVLQQVTDSGKFNGVYCFSQIIGEIEDDDTPIIANGDCFYIEVTDMSGVVWKSNTMLCTTKLRGTKLIHYSNTCSSVQTILDTYFGYMVKGYDVRLNCDYQEMTPVSEVELLTTYTGGRELISAIPSETVKLAIGDNAIGVPRYYLRMLNVIFCCDQKSIDGEEVELSEGGISISRSAGYANDMCSCVICKKENSQSYHSVGTNESTYVFVQTENPSTFDNMLDTLPKASEGTIAGEITIITDTPWYIMLDPSDMEDLKPSVISGGIGDNKIYFGMPKNTSGSDIVYSGEVYSQEDDSQIGTITITNPAVNAGGIGSMKLGDTFIIR